MCDKKAEEGSFSNNDIRYHLEWIQAYEEFISSTGAYRFLGFNGTDTCYSDSSHTLKVPGSHQLDFRFPELKVSWYPENEGMSMLDPKWDIIDVPILHEEMLTRTRRDTSLHESWNLCVDRSEHPEKHLHDVKCWGTGIGIYNWYHCPYGSVESTMKKEMSKDKERFLSQLDDMNEDTDKMLRNNEIFLQHMTNAFKAYSEMATELGSSLTRFDEGFASYIQRYEYFRRQFDEMVVIPCKSHVNPM